ncbi:hypothetical protein NXX99_03625 [Bacteroides thetaiotaomicron]|nr:hypothetical protein [Bacteroides thetaiotaomicron]
MTKEIDMEPLIRQYPVAITGFTPNEGGAFGQLLIYQVKILEQMLLR